ncbi:type 2 lanthipeptide synthetase LanM [Longimicrobium sp.]|uniref:type 2 lanthipeptide synthetase LanM n=1 Tax=Longimicrobium sp. TaxID=2029185 RepID=UPI003B3A4668
MTDLLVELPSARTRIPAVRISPPTQLPVELDDAIRLAGELIIPELLADRLATARRELEAHAARRGWCVEPSTLEDMTGWLRQMLARLTNLVVLQRFSSFHLVRNPLWRPIEAPPGDAPAGAPRDVLEAYVAWEKVERLLSEDGPYPELGRLLSVTLHRDAIAALCGCTPATLGPLTGARFGISDPHGGGRTAAVLSFGARRVIYKPRSVDGEAGWAEIAGRVVREGLGLPSYQAGVAALDGYGFMEMVRDEPCKDEEGVRRCYRRYGAVIATAHALGTCDLHHENVVVTGEHPVVVDAEPLFRARLGLSPQGQDRLDFERNLSMDGLEVRESVLELGLLPLTMRSPLPPEGEERPEYEIGALCAYAGAPIRDLVPCARGSDDLQMRYVDVAASRFPNLPSLAGTPRLPEAYVDEVVEGFEVAHAWLRARREEFTGPGGVLERMAGLRVRMLARPTMDYVSVLSRSISPEAMRSLAARVARVEADLGILGGTRFDTVDDLAAAEAASLLAGDIPRLELRAGGTRSGGAVLHVPPLDAARARWGGLDEVDRSLQVVCIRERLAPRPVSAPAAEGEPGPAQLERHGVEVAGALVSASRPHDGAPSWVYAVYAPGVGTTMAHRDRESLYEGAAGTAVAVAEAARVAGERTWARLAVDVFQPLLHGATPESTRRSGGMGRGLGGVLYAMARVADATGEAALLDTAVRLAVEHGPALAARDALDEVLYGRAGLLLSVLALHARRPGERLLRVADALAGELLRRASRTSRGTCWPGPAGAGMPNVSHGTSGVAMALARWAAVRGDARAADAARDALRYDDAFWVAEERGWMDARLEGTDPEQLTTWAWCNGRSGALLARLAVSRALGDPFVAGCACDALHAHASDVLDEVSPGLCCGTPGVVDALLQLRPHAHGTAVDGHLQGAVRRLACDTPRSQYSTLTGALFTGMAGMSFALLRAARPDRVAPLLTFE